MIMEEQAIANEPTLNDYVYTPFGSRHDGPIYTFTSTPESENEIIDLFSDYISSPEAQKLATEMGFNKHENYKPSESLNGSELYAAQALRKKNKSGGMPTVAVFVADTSGSMDGSRITSLKESLLNAMQYIDETSEIGLVSFSNDVAVELPIGKFEGIQRSKFQSAVKSLKVGGGTHMYSGITVGLDLLRQYEKSATEPCRYMLFVLSDGATGGGINEKIVSQLIVSYGIPVHAIGYSAEADAASLNRIASYTEGFSVGADESNVIYNMKNIFNSQM